MADKKNYDRWGKTCVKVVKQPKTTTKKTVKRGK